MNKPEAQESTQVFVSGFKAFVPSQLVQVVAVSVQDLQGEVHATQAEPETKYFWGQDLKQPVPI